MVPHRKFDSIFSPHLAQFADEYQMPNANDEPILPRKQVEDSLNTLGDTFAKSTVDLIQAEALRMANALANADEVTINKYEWKVQRPLETLMWGLWAQGWEMAQDHAIAEIESLVQDNTALLSNNWENWADFARKKKVVETDPLASRSDRDRRTARGKAPRNVVREIPRQLIGRRVPPADLGKVVPLRKSYLEQAIRDRVMLLSEDMDAGLMNEFKDHLRAWKGITPEDPNYTNKWGEGSINKTQMYDRIQQSLEGDPAEQDRQGGVAARAKNIGYTEGTGVYTLGKLHSFKDLEAQSGGKLRIRKVRYQTFEYSRPVPGAKPCMKCLPKNGHVLDLDRQWNLIMSTYLIPAHGRCRCYWLPILEGTDTEAAMVASPTRTPGANVGESLGAGWLGFVVNAAGGLVMSESAKATARDRMAQARQQKKRQQLMKAGATAAATLSFAGLLYAFSQYWNQRQVQQRTGGNVVAPDELRRAAMDALQQMAPEMGDAVGNAVSDAIGAIVPAQPVTLAGKQPMRVLLNTERAKEIIERMTPDLVQKIAQKRKVSYQEAQLLYLQSIGYSREEAQRVAGALRVFQSMSSNVVVNGRNINQMTEAELVASGAFGPAEARAIAGYRSSVKPITDWAELQQIRDASNQPIFNTQQIQRLQLRGLLVNLNDAGLTAAGLTNRVRMDASTANRIMAARRLGDRPFDSVEDLRLRLTEAILAERFGREGPAALRTARRAANNIINRYVKPGPNQILRIDPIRGEPLPNLDEIERLVDGDLSPAMSNPALRQQLQIPGAPPIPTDVQGATQAAIVDDKFRRELGLIPDNIRRQYQQLDRKLTDKVDPKLKAQVQEQISINERRRREAQAYESLAERSRIAEQQATDLAAQADALLAGGNTNDMDALLKQMTGNVKGWKAIDDKLGDNPSNAIGTEKVRLDAAAIENQELLFRLQDDIRTALVRDQVEGGEAATQYDNLRAILDNFERNINRLPITEQATLRQQSLELRELLANDFQQTTLIQNIQNQINSLSAMSNSLVQANTSVAGDRARLQGAIAQLQEKQQQLKAQLRQQRATAPPPTRQPRQRRTFPEQYAGIPTSIITKYEAFRKAKREATQIKRQQELVQAIQDAGLSVRETQALLEQMADEGLLNFSQFQRWAEFCQRRTRPQILTRRGIVFRSR